MSTVPPDPCVPTALIVEEQLLIVPFLAEVTRRAGLQPVLAKRATLSALRRLRPAVILLGIDMRAARPLEVLRLTRRVMPAAKIVVITRRDDPAWNAVARALGADVVLGTRADALMLTTAVRGA